MLSHSNSRSPWNPWLASLQALGLLIVFGVALAAGPVAADDDSTTLVLVADGTPARSDRDLYLEAILNGVPTHKLVHVTDLGHGRLAASAATLRAIGLRIGNDAPGGRVELDSVHGLEYRYARDTQRLYLNAPADLLTAPAEQLNASEAALLPTDPALPAALLNYDLHGTLLDGGGRSLGAFGDVRISGLSGVLEGSLLGNYANRTAGGDSRTVRLDTSWSWPQRGSLINVVAGDSITGALSWTRATRFGGLQVRRDFALQPDLITFPVPAFRGQAALPSSVELYVNGLRQYSGEVAPGAFQLNTAPLINGYGQAQVVLTDALGRRTTIDFPFYTTGQLLKPGLSDWSLEAGYVRRHYAQTSFDYDHRLAGSGTLRYGLTPLLTLETHAEGASGLVSGGAGAVLGVGTAGVFNAAAAGSRADGAVGWQYQLGYAWRYRWFNLALDHVQASSEYRDLASFASPLPARRRDSATMGFTLGAAGSLGASYLQLDQPGSGASRYASLFYTLSFAHNASLYASATRDLDGGRSVYQLGISVDLGRSIYGSAAFTRNAGSTLLQTSLNRPVPGDGGYGWNLRAQGGGGGANGEADASWLGRWGQIGGGALSYNGSAQAYADLAGAAVLLRQGLFLSRTVDDAFALVSSDGVGGVPVLLENRPIGKTDAAGYYLLTPLNAYQRNRVSIDPMQLAGDLELTHEVREVVPQDRAGALVRFDIRRPQAAVITLRDAAGAPLPLGSRVVAVGGAQPALVGYDGMVYLEGLSAHNELQVTTPEGRACRATFDYRPEKGRIPRIGPLECR